MGAKHIAFMDMNFRLQILIRFLIIIEVGELVENVGNLKTAGEANDLH